MFKMITAHLQFVAEVFGRNGFNLRSQRPEGRAGSRLRQILSALRGRRRQHSPPLPLSNHLRRDIGLEPLPVRKDWIW
jgi:hypothetical protein